MSETIATVELYDKTAKMVVTIHPNKSNEIVLSTMFAHGDGYHVSLTIDQAMSLARGLIEASEALHARETVR